jgi:membrane protease YdiL (CAAX protease family)
MYALWKWWSSLPATRCVVGADLAGYGRKAPRTERMYLTPDGSQAPVANTGSFAPTFIVALGLALAAAAILAPVAAIALMAAGLRFPFPRIFDRTIMVILVAALMLFARRLKLVQLLRRGFSKASIGIWQALSGLALAGIATAILFVVAVIAGADINGSTIASSSMRYFPAAALIAVIEEGFFRAFLLAGIENDLGSGGALFASSAIFAIVHVVRSPARYFVTSFQPMAGVENVAAYAQRMMHPEIGPSLFGLFLLGMVFGEAFILTRRAYCSLGLHLGFVLGAKSWRLAASGAIPRWLAGAGSGGLVAAPAAWVISTIMLMALPLMPRFNQQQHGQAHS